MAMRAKDLHGATDDDLRNELAADDTRYGALEVLQELRNREMIRLTRHVRWLTVAVLIGTLANIAAIFLRK